MAFLAAALRATRLALPKLGVAYMAVLLAANFNRIAINELGITAALVTTLISLHYFLSPFQVVFGWLSDRAPILGLRRTPYMIGGAVLASAIFPAIPGLLVAVAAGSWAAGTALLGLVLLYGVGLAALGDAHHALIADVIPERQRGPVVTLVWLVLIGGFIAASIVQQVVMPRYDAVAMQRLYNLAPLIVIGSTLLGCLGIERRGQQVAERGSLINPLRPALHILRSQREARAFFAFIFLAMLAIFLQDGLLEVFGARVFALTPGETAAFTQSWSVGALIGMVAMGLLSGLRPLPRRLVAGLGGVLTMLGLGLLALSAAEETILLLGPAIGLMGLGAGVFNIGALTMMIEMTSEGQRGTAMGLWGTAQALGTGLASILAGSAYSAFVEQLGLSDGPFFAAFFAAEGLVMVAALVALQGVRVTGLQTVTADEFTYVLATNE